MLSRPVISSKDNPLVKYLKDLQEKPSRRREERAFVMEGVSLSQEALSSGLATRLVIASGLEARPDIRGLLRAAEHGDVQVSLFSEGMMKAVSSLTTSPGVMTVAKMPEWKEDEALKSRRPLLLLCGLQDPGNVGTIIRTAEAAGAGGVLCTPGTVDPYNSKVVRGSMGSILRMPVLGVNNTSVMLKRLRDAGYAVLATDAGAPETCYEADLKSPFLILVGQESAGVPDDLLSSVDRTISIPMEGKAESLNAAMAAGIILFEAKRQRTETR